MAKYLRKKKPNWFLRIFLFILIFIASSGIGAAAFVVDKLDRISYVGPSDVTGTVSTFNQDLTLVVEHDFEDYVVPIEGLDMVGEPATVPDSEVNSNSKVVNILLIGTDERTSEYNANARADSMIIVSINKKRNTVRLVSLERGIGVPILEGELEGQYDLLTHIFRWGGADLLVKTVEHCFKIDVDHYIRLNFAAVKEIVDAIGGIEISLSDAEAQYLNAGLDNCASTSTQSLLHSGSNHLDGGMALAYARLREIDSDWQRVGRQRAVILAVVDSLKDSGLRELNSLADTVLPLIQTNLSKLDIAELMLYAPNFLNAEFDQMTIPKKGTYGGMSIRNGGGAFAVDYEINNAILKEFLYGDASSEELLGY